MLINRIKGKIFDYTIYKSLYKAGDTMLLFSKRRPPKDNYIINEINKTKIAMEAAYSNFQNVVDPDLIDSCIYELNAVQNRYKFLLKLAKESDTTCC
ncbi:MAG: hypothetical protein K0R00_1287 [Herbinix sp.]|jgi:hypothetical protein|nr:hypothetical protein [Herbinix sp.]